MNTVICVTENEFAKAQDLFSDCPDFTCLPAPSEELALAQAVVDHGAGGVIVGVEKYKDQLYRALPLGAVLARFGVGHEGIDKARATEQGLLVSNTPQVLDDSVAEQAVFMMGCLARHIAVSHLEMRNQLWRPGIGTELRNKRLLIIGCGSIGCKTARIAAFGLGMRVSGYDNGLLDCSCLKQEFGIREIHHNLDLAMLGQADFISLHLPATAATRNFVDQQFLAAMKPEALLVNTARGTIIDEAALFVALETGQIAGAALDVFREEPYLPAEPSRDLRSMDKVLLTPHIGSSTREACCRMGQCCLENIRNGRDRRFNEMNLLNPEVLDILT